MLKIIPQNAGNGISETLNFNYIQYVACVATLGVGGGGGRGVGDRWGRRAPAITYWYFSFCQLIKSLNFKMYCQQIFPFIQVPYHFLQSYFEALSFQYANHVFQTLFEPLTTARLPAILNSYDCRATPSLVETCVSRLRRFGFLEGEVTLYL